MVKVIKRDKSLQGFQKAKIIRACKRSGTPEPVAKAIALMIYRKVKNKKTVSSVQIKKMIFIIFAKTSKAPKEWKSYAKKKYAKKPKKKKKKSRKKR